VIVEPAGAAGAELLLLPDPQLATSASGRHKAATRTRDSVVSIISIASFFVVFGRGVGFPRLLRILLRYFQLTHEF
jgi:hypothetical protein